MNRAWGSTPSDNIPSISSTIDPQPAQHGVKKRFNLNGWKKSALYAILLFLMVIVFVNIGLTLWIITVLNMTSHGMGPIKVVKGGLQINGNIFVEDKLIASTIQTKPGQSMSFDTYRNFTVNVYGDDGLETRVNMAKNRFDIKSKKFRILGPQHQTLFSASPDVVYLGVDTLALGGEGGVIFDNSVQTSQVLANAGEALSLESPTRSLEMRAPESLILESKAGEIKASAFKDLTLYSMTGKIHLDAGTIHIKNMKTATRLPEDLKVKHRKNIYQVCACADGKLFLANADGVCESTDDHFCK